MTSMEDARRRLEEQLAQIRNRTEKIDKDLRRENNPLDKDWTEAATIRENDEVLEALDQEGREQIAQLEAALERIREGTYGTCSICAGSINPDRLEALPQATECIECARKNEANA